MTRACPASNNMAPNDKTPNSQRAWGNSTQHECDNCTQRARGNSVFSLRATTVCSACVRQQRAAFAATARSVCATRRVVPKMRVTRHAACVQCSHHPPAAVHCFGSLFLDHCSFGKKGPLGFWSSQHGIRV